jgi:hypothetical protein
MGVRRFDSPVSVGQAVMAFGYVPVGRPRPLFVTYALV